MANENSGKPWVQIVIALIGGAALVLAALIPALISSQKRLEVVTRKADSADSESTALRAQLTEAEERLKDCQAKPTVTIPCPDPPPPPPKNDQTQSVSGILFRLKQPCKRNGTSVTCDLSATAEAKDSYFCCFQQSHIIDRSGRDFSISRIAFGQQEGTGICTELARGVPLAGRVQFEGIPLENRDAALLELACNFKVQFRDVPFE